MQQFGLACGGSLGLQAVRDLQGDMAAHPSDSFSVSLFMLLLSLEDREIVSAVARSPELLLKLVQITSECQESRYNMMLFVLNVRTTIQFCF